jgi:hypothetical protein
MRAATASLALCVLAGGTATAHAGDAWRTTLLLGLIAVAVNAAAFRTRGLAALVTCGVLLIAGYALGSAGATETIDPLAPPFGVCLFLMAELWFLALEIPFGLSGDARARRRYVRSVTGVVLASLVVGEILVIVAGGIGGAAQALLLVGAAAAVPIAAILQRLALAYMRESGAPEL